MDKYIGRLLDNRYEILEVIGTGGMAVVYKARCHRLNRLVAVKILKDEYSQDEEFRRRFHAEGQAVAMLSHPNIVQVYDVSTSDDADYIVMELIDGITLKQYMEKKGILNWKETLHFSMQIAKALEHAHSRGIIHRDIKPHNVMVLKNGSVKVADFGIARVVSKSNTLTKEALGSVHYISPEQAKGGHVDNRSDIYSLGVVMYEMMAGRPPYDGESPVAVAIQHINGGAPLPSTFNPNIPGGLEQIIMKAMAVDPNDRYPSATAMLYDMDEFRKEPTMLFDYHNGLASEDILTVHTPQPQQPRAPRTTAERVAGTGSDVPRRRPPQDQPRRTSQPDAQRRKPSQSSAAASQHRKKEDDGNRAATIAIVACSAVAVIAIVIFLVTLLNGGVFNQRKNPVEVPNLIGQVYDQVRTDTQYADFEIVLSKSEPSDQYEDGQIMDQRPKGGEMVEDKKIYVVVSSGKEKAVEIMEDLTNVARADAEVYLSGQKVKALVREEYNDDVKAGYVIRTDPEAGAELTDGQTVTLWVSMGPEIKKAKMPNVVGQPLETALTVLSASGFNNVETVPVESNREKNEVVSQSVRKNEEVDVTTAITLEVSKGPAETTAPTTEPPTEPPLVTKRIKLTLPTDMTETYTLSLKQGDTEVVSPTEVEPTQTTIEVELQGSGVQYYDLYVNEKYYQTVKVDFTANG